MPSGRQNGAAMRGQKPSRCAIRNGGAAAIKPVPQEHAINTKGTGSAGRTAAPGSTANGPPKPTDGTKVRTKSNQANE